MTTGQRKSLQVLGQAARKPGLSWKAQRSLYAAQVKLLEKIAERAAPLPAPARG